MKLLMSWYIKVFQTIDYLFMSHVQGGFEFTENMDKLNAILKDYDLEYDVGVNH